MKRYNIIYADPPWSFGNRMYSSNKNDHHREISRAFTTMSTKDICSLNVKNIAAEDCALFMWTTDAHIPDALEVMKAWGLNIKQLRLFGKKRKNRVNRFALWGNGQ